jgi:ferredoxin
MYRIIQDREACIGCGACVSVCPENWEMKDDGKSSPIKTEVEEIGCNQDAADICPVQCIKIEEA